MRLQAEDGSGDSGLGLHFDLTVPFARYVLENAGKLEFPFRRYQIQKAWRGERPQEGRFREFTQADIDVVGRDDLPFHHDIEVARVMVEAMSRLDFLPPMTLQVNNRKLIEGFYRGDRPRATRCGDAGRRPPRQDVAGRREEAARDRRRVGRGGGPVPGLRDDPSTDTSFVDRVRALGVEHELLDEGLTSSAAVVRALRRGERPGRVVADLAIARGSTTTPAPCSRSA